MNYIEAIQDLQFDTDAICELAELGGDSEILARIARTSNLSLYKASEIRKKVAESLTKGVHISWSELENLSEAQAFENVFFEVATILKYGWENDLSSSESVAAVRDVALRYSLSTHRINSSSNYSVELDLATKLEWTRVAAIVTGRAL